MKLSHRVDKNFYNVRTDPLAPVFVLILDLRSGRYEISIYQRYSGLLGMKLSSPHISGIRIFTDIISGGVIHRERQREQIRRIGLPWFFRIFSSTALKLVSSVQGQKILELFYAPLEFYYTRTSKYGSSLALVNKRKQVADDFLQMPSVQIQFNRTDREPS